MNETTEPVEEEPVPADGDVRDALPDDLDARGAGLVGPYVFPDNDRRRIPGFIYLVLAAVT
ncbi:MAG: hypothetical protein GY900_11415, partial [Actinomycetia bacterium]|nr:hypothetical protein [Actinomycetes bacterium]